MLTPEQVNAKTQHKVTMDLDIYISAFIAQTRSEATLVKCLSTPEMVNLDKTK